MTHRVRFAGAAPARRLACGRPSAPRPPRRCYAERVVKRGQFRLSANLNVTFRFGQNRFARVMHSRAIRVKAAKLADGTKGALYKFKKLKGKKRKKAKR